MSDHRVDTAVDNVTAVRTVLAPKSVAIIGASPVGRGFTSAPVINLKRHGYQGRIYAVNPKYEEVLGVPCYPTLGDIPDAVETAVAVVGAKRVASTLAECASKGLTSATVIAGGFAELGSEGLELEHQIRSTLSASGLRLVGPNTAGLMSPIESYVPRAALNHPEQLLTGSVALVTQSGALCNTVLNRAMGRGVGLSHAIATGSQWDLDIWDFAEYLTADERVSSIMLVVEGLKDASKALRAATLAAEAGKPLIMMKPGRSDLGAQAVQTHSGALSGESSVQFSILRDHGMIVVDELDQLWETAMLFHHWGSPSRRVQALGVATYSGGDGAIAVDAMDGTGLRLPQPSQATASHLTDAFELATSANPFDFTGEVVGKPELIGPAFRALLDDPAFDCCLLAAPVWSGHFAEWILGPALDEGRAAQGATPVAVSLWGAAGVTEEAEALVRSRGLPLFDGSHRAVGAIARYSAFADWLIDGRPGLGAPFSHHVGIHGPGDPSGADRRTSVQDYWQSRESLKRAHVPFNEAALVRSRDEAAVGALKLGFPVTMKALSGSAVHKVAAGAVKLYLQDEQEVAATWDGFASRFGNADLRVVIESYAPSVAMALLGGVRSPEFGPVIVFGLGGGYAEAFGDVSHALAPLTSDQARSLIAQTKVGKMLSSNALVIDELSDIISKTSTWFADDESVVSFDVNPLLIGLDNSVIAVDARVETTTS